MKDRLTKGEITKDALQSTVEAGADTVATVATILTGAVRDVARAVGGFATEVFEIREASRQARLEAEAYDGPAAVEARGPLTDEGPSSRPSWRG